LGLIKKIRDPVKIIRDPKKYMRDPIPDYGQSVPELKSQQLFGMCHSQVKEQGENK